MPRLRAEAGSRPGGRGTFLCFAKEKYPKERRPPVCDPFAERRGKPASSRLWGAPWNSLRCVAASFRHPRRVRARSTRASTRVPPHNRPAAGAASRGGAAEHPNSRTAIRAIAALGLARAARGACARESGPSAAMARVDVLLPCPSGCAEERRVWRIRARDCLSEVKRSEFERDPAKPEHRRLPRSEAQGTQTVGSPFLWFLSFGDAKERDSPAGRLPASALEKGMRPNQPPHQILQNQ